MKIPILMYHEIASHTSFPSSDGNMHPSYYVSNENFKTHLRLISELGITTVTLGNLQNAADVNSGKIVLSFDDGYFGNYKNALPLLKEHGMVATFFCAVSLIGKENMMTWSQLKEMSSQRMSIQSHGYSHQPLAALKKEEICEELKRSKGELEDKLGEKVSYISLPHGSYSDFVIDKAKEIGYEKVCTSLVGYNKGTEYCLRRIVASAAYDIEKYKRIMTAQYDFTLVRLSKKVKLGIKNIIGHDTYLNLYHYLNKLRK